MHVFAAAPADKGIEAGGRFAGSRHAHDDLRGTVRRRAGGRGRAGSRARLAGVARASREHGAESHRRSPDGCRLDERAARDVLHVPYPFLFAARSPRFRKTTAIHDGISILANVSGGAKARRSETDATGNAVTRVSPCVRDVSSKSRSLQCYESTICNTTVAASRSGQCYESGIRNLSTCERGSGHATGFVCKTDYQRQKHHDVRRFGATGRI